MNASRPRNHVSTVWIQTVLWKRKVSSIKHGRDFMAVFCLIYWSRLGFSTSNRFVVPEKRDRSLMVSDWLESGVRGHITWLPYNNPIHHLKKNSQQWLSLTKAKDWSSQKPKTDQNFQHIYQNISLLMKDVVFGSHTVHIVQTLASPTRALTQWK